MPAHGVGDRFVVFLHSPPRLSPVMCSTGLPFLDQSTPPEKTCLLMVSVIFFFSLALSTAPDTMSRHDFLRWTTLLQEGISHGGGDLFCVPARATTPDTMSRHVFLWRCTL
jgi:hypothetical protein